jgi:hypothetical protein
MLEEDKPVGVPQLPLLLVPVVVKDAVELYELVPPVVQAVCTWN